MKTELLDSYGVYIFLYDFNNPKENGNLFPVETHKRPHQIVAPTSVTHRITALKALHN